MSEQPKPTADQPLSGKDLPTGPGVWKRDGQRYWCCTEYPPYVVKIGELGKLSNCVYLVSQLPRGNWFQAVTKEAITQERHQAEVYRKQMVEAEAIVKELGVQVGNLTGELDWQKKQTEYIRDLANKQRGEIESLNFMADAVERLRDIGRVIGCDHVDDADGRRQLVNCVEQVFAEVTQQLTAANSRLAKVREALTRLGKWTELSPFAEDILVEAKAALAEGEG